MAEITLNTIGDLGDRHAIYAHCTACRHAAELPTSQLAARYGSSLTIPELRNRLTCSKCGTRSRELRIVFTLPAR